MSIAPTQHKHRLPKAQALLLSLPDPEHQSTTWESAFASAAERVLHGLELIIFGKRFRLVEVEFYLTSDAHPDPFTHLHEVQRAFGQWYLHRQGSGYRGGSFKGLDLTFGDGQAFGGMLLRSIEADSGEFICGPSLIVAAILRQSPYNSVAELDRRLDGVGAWTEQALIQLRETDAPTGDVYRSARVGLGGGRGSGSRDLFADRSYRFLSEPRLVKKGRPELIRQMHRDGYSAAQIREITGSPRHTIMRRIGSEPTANSV